ncbi:MAG: glycosyltransferase family 2 protein [Bacteroidales bacterium]|nr:glycosyltransferase family 2 protein [Bacteroidales bacterium]
MKTVNIIIPCYNEENNLGILFKRLDEVLRIPEYQFNYLFVDDGSSDGTFSFLKKTAQSRKNVKVLRLSRNFGSHIGISAGIENSFEADAIVLLPADLQEPPELIPELLKKWEDGAEVVWTIREKRAQSFVGKLFSRLFYKIFISGSNLRNYPKEGPSAFFLLDHKVIREWQRFGESNRMIIGLIVWMGFRQEKVYYTQNQRISGKSSWGFMKLLKVAIDSFVSFSFAPIRFISYIGIIVSLVGFIYAMVLIFNKIFFGTGPTGWTSIMVIMLFLGGIQLITLGIIGEYVWRGVDESRKRPLYLISDKLNFENVE